ncbi:hypothetical protein BH10ACI2_BH10ACI2_18890 [soil metagenome]
MNELDHVWSQMLENAAEKAGADGRRDVVDYLRLRATNDAIRRAGVDWLFGTMIEIAGRAVRDFAAITMEREEPHSFARGASNMVGSLLEIRQGVRCITLEAGWTRTPSDGIMQKGALAFARVNHFGMPKLGVEIKLVHSESLPNWLDEEEKAFDSGELRRHFDLFLGREF